MLEPNSPIPTSTLEYYQSLPAPTWRPPRQRYWLHILLFLATCFTTLMMGARMQYNFNHDRPALYVSDDDTNPPMFPVSWAVSHPGWLLAGWPFAATVMLFFLAHEMGHYLYCRHYGIYATLPFFIPMPTIIGTMGAVILIRSKIRSKTALFDVGIGGPIAGFVLAFAALAISLGWSKPLPAGAPAGDYQLGFPLIFEWMQHGLALVNPQGVEHLPLQRVLLHPTAIAAWVGMFATSLNLLPGGQLDGGHITFAISPKAHRIISWLTIVILLPLAYFESTVWWLWAVLLQLTSLRHPQVEDWPRISGARIWLAVFAGAMLVLTFTPAPFLHTSTAELIVPLREWIHEWIKHRFGR